MGGWRMRAFLLFIGWASIVGSVADGAILVWVLALAVAGAVEWSVTVDAFLQTNMQPLYWVKQLAFYVLPQDVVVWLFALPAVVYFPSRILLSGVIGAAAFAAAEKKGRGKDA